MSLTSLAVNLVNPLPKLESFSRYMFIGPHPDDIEIGAGATAAKLAAVGKAVCFLICIDGRFGDGSSGGLHGDALAGRRREEALASAGALGITDVRFLNLTDGGFYNQDELISGIASVVGDFKPDVIFAPDPDVKSECHADHLNVGRAAKQIACFAPHCGIMNRYGAEAAPVKCLSLYMTASPNSYVKTGGYLDLQLDSIFNNHLSQYPEDSGDAKAIKLYLKIRSVDFGIRCLCSCAEGFRTLNSMSMHCLPEAGIR